MPTSVPSTLLRATASRRPSGYCASLRSSTSTSPLSATRRQHEEMSLASLFLEGAEAHCRSPTLSARHPLASEVTALRWHELAIPGPVPSATAATRAPQKPIPDPLFPLSRLPDGPSPPPDSLAK